jgi:hypothetical protein
VTIQLVGAPGTEIRMTPAEVAAADPGKLIVRQPELPRGRPYIGACTSRQSSNGPSEAGTQA